MITPLDKVFITYIGTVYKSSLDKLSVDQVIELRRAFFAGATGAKVMMDAAIQDPPTSISIEKGQMLLDSIVEFTSKLRDDKYNQMLAVAILFQVRIGKDKVSRN